MQGILPPIYHQIWPISSFNNFIFNFIRKCYQNLFFFCGIFSLASTWRHVPRVVGRGGGGDKDQLLNVLLLLKLLLVLNFKKALVKKIIPVSIPLLGGAQPVILPGNYTPAWTTNIDPAKTGYQSHGEINHGLIYVTHKHWKQNKFLTNSGYIVINIPNSVLAMITWASYQSVSCSLVFLKLGQFPAIFTINVALHACKLQVCSPWLIARIC